MTLNRRLLLGAAAATLAAPAVKAQAPAPRFVQPALPYADTALAPVISQRTVQFHYGRHHAGQYAALNRLVENRFYATLNLEQVVRRASIIPEDQGILNQAGQALNHDIYWRQFTPGGPKVASGALLAKIDTELGGFAQMKTNLIAAANGVFGSGWGWLVQNPDGRLAIVTTPNGNNPLGRGQTPLVGIDVWEHAYYLDWENDRLAHVRAVVDELVNWSVVAERLRTS
jgi:superoxide dismutase, Fe-Mn family